MKAKGKLGRKDISSRSNKRKIRVGWGSDVAKERDILEINCRCETQHSEQ